jgi:hypothetical protein
VRHADLRLASDLEGLPDVDAVVDAAASPSVLGGLDGSTSSRQSVAAPVSEWCRERLFDHEVKASPRSRPFDLPWIVLDASLARGGPPAVARAERDGLIP